MIKYLRDVSLEPVQYTSMFAYIPKKLTPSLVKVPEICGKHYNIY